MNTVVFVICDNVRAHIPSIRFAFGLKSRVFSSATFKVVTAHRVTAISKDGRRSHYSWVGTHEVDDVSLLS